MVLPSKKIRQGLVEFDMLLRNFKKSNKNNQMIRRKSELTRGSLFKRPRHLGSERQRRFLSRGHSITTWTR